MSVLADLRIVLRGPDYRRLLEVRLCGQAGDGIFQTALASLFFFSPERATSPAGVATAFAVLLLPFTLVGPWAGVLLDRWRRRQLLVVANLARAGLTLAVAGLVVTRAHPLVLYVAVLGAVSVNRFLLAGLSAALPHVVPPDELVMANSVSPTAGGVAALAGGALAFAARSMGGGGEAVDAALLCGAAVVFAGSALLARRMAVDLLGPDAPLRGEAAARAVRSVLPDVVAGLRHLAGRRTAAAALAVITAQRFGYGLQAIAVVLLCRNHLPPPAAPDAGLGLLAVVVGAAGAGYALAAVLTPVATTWYRPCSWIRVCLAAGAAALLTLAALPGVTVLVAVAFLIGLSSQSLKICVDTLVQRGVDDAYRGRVFTVYDMAFNIAFVGAAALAVPLVPADGVSPALDACIAASWLLVAVLHRRAALRAPALVGGRA